MRFGFAPCRVRRLRSPWQRLLGTRRGNSVALFALSALPVLAGLSLGVDYMLARVIRGKLDLAADSAALQATTAASDAYLAGTADAMAVGIAAARARFTSQIASERNLQVSPLQVALSQRGGLFNATVSYSATMGTTIARVIGIDSLPISGQASASVSYNPPVDIQLLLDTSSSMTLAASAADRARLEKLTTGFKFVGKPPAHIGKGEACAFACHWSNTGPDFYQLAEKNRIPLRIGVVRDAVAGLIRSMAGLDSDQRFQLGLYSFNSNFTVLAPLTHDLASAQTALALITAAVTECSTQCADTAFSRALQSLAKADAALPQPAAEGGGDAIPQRYLMIVTDGVRDEPLASATEAGPVQAADCNAMKRLGFSVLVLYLPYPALPANAYYGQSLAAAANRIVPALQACASAPGYYFEAREPADIATQLNNMFRLVLRTSSRPIN